MIKVYVNEDNLVIHDKKNEKGYVNIYNLITNLCPISWELGGVMSMLVHLSMTLSHHKQSTT